MIRLVDHLRTAIQTLPARPFGACGQRWTRVGRAARSLLLLAPSLTAIGAIAGPFGLHQGMSLADLKRQGSFTATSQEFVFNATVLAGAHPDISSYDVLLTPAQGLCQVKAVSKGIDTTADGAELLRRFRGLADVMASKYGPPTNVYDHLRMGSLLHASHEWMIGLLKQDRVLIAEWSPPEPAPPRDTLSSIKMTATALSENRGQIEFDYRLGNFRECQGAIRAIINARSRL